MKDVVSLWGYFYSIQFSSWMRCCSCERSFSIYSFTRMVALLVDVLVKAYLLIFLISREMSLLFTCWM